LSLFQKAAGAELLNNSVPVEKLLDDFKNKADATHVDEEGGYREFGEQQWRIAQEPA
jgi:hypothetical protein